MMDTPPKKTTPSGRRNLGNEQGHPLTNSHTTPVDLDLTFSSSHVTTLAQPVSANGYRFIYEIVFSMDFFMESGLFVESM